MFVPRANTERTNKRWLKKFRDGDALLKLKRIADKIMSLVSEKLKEINESCLFTTILEFADELGIF